MALKLNSGLIHPLGARYSQREVYIRGRRPLCAEVLHDKDPTRGIIIEIAITRQVLESSLSNYLTSSQFATASHRPVLGPGSKANNTKTANQDGPR
nr:unnamed protein product [Spirometra erinaceieuropaei]